MDKDIITDMDGSFSIMFHCISKMPEAFTMVFTKETEALMPKSIKTISKSIHQNTSGI